MNCRRIGPDMRVLVVDDDGAMRALLAATLMHCGALDVVEAADGAAALRALARPGACFDLLVTDLRMGGMDGIELLERIGQRQVGAIALASALGAEVREAAARVARAKGHRLIGTIGKPFQPDAVAAMLAAAAPAAAGAPRAASRAPQRRWRASELQCALAQRQFAPYFQPKVDLASGRATGVEVLARWHHPRLGLIGPGDFIDTMEANGMIGVLADTMLQQALAGMNEWDRRGAALTIAVNVALQTLLDPSLPNRLSAMVSAAGIAPERVTIEVTESGIDVSAQAILEGVTRLRMFGFKVAVDDFGTGNSTLLQLSQIPFTELKIDRFFVAATASPEKRRTILESIVQMAGRLGLHVVAEGIEQDSEHDFLRALGCDTGQGFLYGRPMAHGDLLSWLRDRRLS